MDSLITAAKWPMMLVAHGDDESLWGGGLLARYAHKNWTVVCCTVPWADPIRTDKFRDACAVFNARPVVVREDGVIDATPVTPQIEQPATAHWIEEASKTFWPWTERMGLTHDQVHEALGVKSVKEFKGDKRAAADAIDAWIEAHVAQAQSDEDALVEKLF